MSRTPAGAAKVLTSEDLKNHFELFGLVPAYALDLELLDRAYRDIQSRVHPDRFAQAGDAERRAAMQMTTQVNEAYRILKTPVQRAKYLLELNGVDVAFETNTSMPKDFLVEQMELRERLEEAKHASDLDMIFRDLAVARRDIENQIQGKCDAKHDFAAARDLVRKLMFLERLAGEIDAAHERIEMQAPEA